MRRVNPAVAALTFSLALAACVSEVSIEGAPCPCPGGYVCCETLGDTCLPEETECPVAHPISSASACERDTDCPRGELCQLWQLPDGSTAGPGECRRTCDAEAGCAEGERCLPTLHDGLPLDTTNAALACVVAPVDGPCAERSCADCGADGVGRTRCDGDDVRGCFLALHPTCGLVCHDLVVQTCVEAVCETLDDGATCTGIRGPKGLCDDLSCDECGAIAPGTVGCAEDGTLAACTAVSLSTQACSPAPCSCDTACIVSPLGTCELR